MSSEIDDKSDLNLSIHSDSDDEHVSLQKSQEKRKTRQTVQHTEPLDQEEVDEFEDSGEEEEEQEEEIDELDDSFDDEPQISPPKSKKQSKSSSASSSKLKISLKTKPVPYESVFVPLPDHTQIDKLLSWRKNDETGNEEILTKYKNSSYLSSEWLSIDAIKSTKNGKQRVNRFLEKGIYDQWSGTESFNPNFIKVDRVIDEGELEGAVHYLVKWTALTYDDCTWENSEVIEKIDPDAITDFHNRRVLGSIKSASYKKETYLKRPPASQWQELKESPEYKDGNSLRSYQLEGLNWLNNCYYNRNNSILADEMGLGKTIQSTSFLNHIYTQLNVKGPFLVIAPLSTIGNWEREIRGWTDMNLVVYHGSATARNLIVDTEFYYKDAKGLPIPSIYKFDVVLTTYEMAMSGMPQLKPIHWRACVLDEAHKLKNKTSKISESLKQYTMDHRVLLTGTPLQNSLEELWALLNFLEPAKFASENAFQARFGSLSSAKDVQELQSLLKPLMLRRLKEDVEKSIPSKEETVIEVEMTTTQKKWYKSILERNFSWLKQGAKSKNMPNLINTMMELRKCCIHPFLLKGAEEQINLESGADTMEKQFSTLIQASGKMVLIDKLLKKLHSGGHKVLIFSQMTKCLDLIQDYLKGRNYGYERIDGSVRGDLRQASIDRFSTPGNESFVFMLCTRAGGVGINLTVADTVIIFDSDWNPQNDLQAQSRCHRIGQKKAVKIYRLITTNTYERDMFDRASMKLGLDKAVLGRMDSDGATDDPFGNSKGSTLSKQEVENFLKKGAYGAFLDDEASKQFCEEDIDSILERRTKTIKHDSGVTQEKASVFSKATFSSTSTKDQIDIDDPEFWDKVAQQAEFNINDPIDDDMLLIMDSSRQRRRVERFRGDINDDGTPYDSAAQDFYPGYFEEIRREGARVWTSTEKARAERAFMLYGFGAWEQLSETFSKRTVRDMKAIGVCIMKHGLRRLRADNQEEQLQKAIRLILETEEEENPKIEGGVSDTEFIEDKAFEIPFAGATKKEILEYRSFLIDTASDYKEHMARKAKNLLSRIFLMYTIRERIKPEPSMELPSIPGYYPTSWWGVEEDRDLLIGVQKHGYGKYKEIRFDPELCFSKQVFIDTLDPKALSSALTIRLPIQGSGGGEDEEVDDDVDMDDEKNLISSSSSSVVNVNRDTGEQVFEHPEMKVWPSPSELGVRVRRIVGVFQRKFAHQLRKERKEQLIREGKEVPANFLGARGPPTRKDLTKKERGDFRRVLMTFGVETKESDRNVRDWDRFRELSGISKDDVYMEEFFVKLLALCTECIKKAEDLNSKSLDIAKGKVKAEQIKVERDGDSMTLDVAKRLLKRVEMMRRLREEILTNPNIEKNIAIMKGRANSGLPTWWKTEHDIAFLKGVARWGIIKTELMVEDETLPFKQLHQEFLSHLAGKIPGKKEEKFWMRETVASRRFETLCESIAQPGSVGRRRRKRDTDDEFEVGNKYKKKRPSKVSISQRNTSGFDTSDSDSGNTDDMVAKVMMQLAGGDDDEDGEKKKKRNKRSHEGELDSSSLDDLDTLLLPKKKKKKKSKHHHREEATTAAPLPPYIIKISSGLTSTKSSLDSSLASTPQPNNEPPSSQPATQFGNPNTNILPPIINQNGLHHAPAIIEQMPIIEPTNIPTSIPTNIPTPMSQPANTVQQPFGGKSPKTQPKQDGLEEKKETLDSNDF